MTNSRCLGPTHELLRLPDPERCSIEERLAGKPKRANRLTQHFYRLWGGESKLFRGRGAGDFFLENYSSPERPGTQGQGFGKREGLKREKMATKSGRRSWPQFAATSKSAQLSLPNVVRRRGGAETRRHCIAERPEWGKKRRKNPADEHLRSDEGITGLGTSRPGAGS